MPNNREILKQLNEIIGNLGENRVKFEGERIVELNLANLQVTSLPEIIGDLDNLKILNIRESAIETLPESFGNLKNLNELYALNSKLKILPESFGELRNLEYLELKYTQITSLPESFGKLQNLKKAEISGNPLTTFPESFGVLEKLEFLEARKNKLTFLPESFYKLKNLKVLDLRINHLNALPTNFGELHALERLDLQVNNLSTLPESFGELRNLKKAVLDNNQLNILPESIGYLESIIELHAENNQLTSLPNTIEGMKALEWLDLSNNNLTSLPSSLKKLDNLKTISLNGNNLDSIPEFLTELKSLQNFGFGDKDVNYYRANMDIIKKLREMKVSIPRLPPIFWFYYREIPEHLIELLPQICSRRSPRLIIDATIPETEDFYVYVEENKIVGFNIVNQYIKNLPDNFGDFRDLKFLNLTRNKISSLPSSIGNCVNLEVVNLSNNQVTELPDTFRNLTLIKNLNLSNNKFTEIPTQLWALKDLTELDLSNNPFTPEDLTVSKKIPELILDYLRKKATIQVFISHAVIDFESYHIGELVEYLKKQREISEVYFCEADLAGNIDEWMLETVQKCQLLLFIATKKSVFDSVDCANELQLADKFSIPVIPIKGYDVEWPDLAEKKLSRELGLEFDKENFNDFCVSLYKYIENFKREIDLFGKKEREKGITDIYERFRLIMDEKFDEIIRKISNIEERISKLEK